MSNICQHLLKVDEDLANCLYAIYLDTVEICCDKYMESVLYRVFLLLDMDLSYFLYGEREFCMYYRDGKRNSLPDTSIHLSRALDLPKTSLPSISYRDFLLSPFIRNHQT